MASAIKTKRPAVAAQTGSLNLACREHGIPLEVRQRLDRIVEQLKLYETEIRQAAQKKPPLTRQRTLFKIEELLQQVITRVKALPFGDQQALADHFFEMHKQPKQKLLEAMKRAVEPSIIDHPLEALCNSARVTGKRIDVKEGAPSELDQHVLFLQAIFGILGTLEKKKLNGKAFQSVCDAVYMAAGVALPDRAMRKFCSPVFQTILAESRSTSMSRREVRAQSVQNQKKSL